jgi:hypothetical protein
VRTRQASACHRPHGCTHVWRVCDCHTLSSRSAYVAGYVAYVAHSSSCVPVPHAMLLDTDPVTATATPRLAQPCACERLARLLGCVCAAAGWLRRPATLATATHTLVHKDDAHPLTGLRGAHAGFSLLPWLRYSPHTCAAHCMLPQRSPRHSAVVATTSLAVAICMALACCCAPSPLVSAAAASSNSHAAPRTTMRM